MEVEEGNMPPLSTPATAILFMVGFFIVIMGVPLLFVGRKHPMHH